MGAHETWTTLTFFVLTALFLPIGNCYDREMTIHVEAGKGNCFFHNAKIGDVIDIDYQVIDGGHGDLDISFDMFEPSGRIIFADYKKSENIHKHEVKTEGDYQFCFVNTFSSYNRKTIFFELIVESSGNSKENVSNNGFEGLIPEELYEIKIQDILEYIERIRMNLTRARQIQDAIRSHEARDRNVAEENYLKVNAWSILQIILMLLVGGLQVFMVRSIFETDTKMKGFWKKLGL